MFQPLGKRVLIEEIIEEKKQGILILKNDCSKQFKVVAIGDEVNSVKVGDHIVIANYGTTEFKFGDQIHIFVQEENIIAKVT